LSELLEQFFKYILVECKSLNIGFSTAQQQHFWV